MHTDAFLFLLFTGGSKLFKAFSSLSFCRFGRMISFSDSVLVSFKRVYVEKLKVCNTAQKYKYLILSSHTTFTLSRSSSMASWENSSSVKEDGQSFP